ncbi:MAG: DNA double-strand break repair nuclease NurA [Chloroflexaceae bacterium]|nr:DNA double-strand break repair nuclease NurA [Chloroflexaceae bacterium]
MPLDLTMLGQQVRRMSTAMAARVDATSERTAQVAARFVQETGNEAHWREAVSLSRKTASWLFAQPHEPLDTVCDVPPLPTDYALAATDGSQIERDRHGPADCYLINTGRVYLRYGEQPHARLTSEPNLYYRDEDMYIIKGAQRTAIEGNYLSVRRDIDELLALTVLVDEFLIDDNATLPVLALQDGTLIRWALAGADTFVQDYFLRKYLEGLAHLRQRGIPVASYISRPRATELLGTVRLMFCPDVNVSDQRGARCSECSDVKAGREPSCSICNDLVDADVLAQRLQEGQRGPLCVSMSRINIEAYNNWHGGDHLIYFFYMRVGRELARIEMPRWVALNAALVDRVHALIYDQCVRGQGYPVALARAHEQAIVRSADRRTFQRIVEGSLLRAELPATSSRKQEKKERTAL